MFGMATYEFGRPALASRPAIEERAECPGVQREPSLRGSASPHANDLTTAHYAQINEP